MTIIAYKHEHYNNEMKPAQQLKQLLAYEPTVFTNNCLYIPPIKLSTQSNACVLYMHKQIHIKCMY